MFVIIRHHKVQRAIYVDIEPKVADQYQVEWKLIGKSGGNTEIRGKETDVEKKVPVLRYQI